MRSDLHSQNGLEGTGQFEIVPVMVHRVPPIQAPPRVHPTHIVHAKNPDVRGSHKETMSNAGQVKPRRSPKVDRRISEGKSSVDIPLEAHVTYYRGKLRTNAMYTCTLPSKRAPPRVHPTHIGGVRRIDVRNSPNSAKSLIRKSRCHWETKTCLRRMEWMERGNSSSCQ